MRRALSAAGFAALDKECDIMVVFRRVNRPDETCESYLLMDVRLRRREG